MSETEFPLPFDASADEREAAKREIGKHTQVLGDAPNGIRFVGESIGQTGPVWHLQYTRLYRLANGFLVAARDLHEGVKVAFAKDAESLPQAFQNPVVSEFIEDELRFRKVIGKKHGTD